MMPPLVVAVVPVHNRRETTRRFLGYWQQQTYRHNRLVIVDDGSRDGTFEMVRCQAPQAHLIVADGNAWWAGATNLGVRWALRAGADFILTINDDARPATDLVERLVAAAMEHPGSIVGSRIMDAEQPDRIWACGTEAAMVGSRIWRLRRHGERWQGGTGCESVDTLCGNGTLVPAAVFHRVGLYDRSRLPHYHADSDLVLRARRAGFGALVCLDACLWNGPGTPLPNRAWEIIGSKRSPLYVPTLARIIVRHGPWHAAPWLLLRHVLPPLARSACLPGRSKRRRSHAH